MVSSRVQAATAGLGLGILSLGSGCHSDHPHLDDLPDVRYSGIEHCLSSMLPLRIKEVEYIRVDNAWKLSRLPEVREIKPRFGSQDELKRWLRDWLPKYEDYLQERGNTQTRETVHPLTFETSPYVIHGILPESIASNELESIQYLKGIETQFGDLSSVTELDRYVHLVDRLNEPIIIRTSHYITFIGTEEAVDNALK